MAAARARTFHAGRGALHQGDCLAVMDALPEASVDLVLTDPPYHFASIVARFGGPNAAPCAAGRDGSHARLSRGFMGATWDGGTVAFKPETWAKALRVLKPGGHLLAFGAPKNAHWLGVAIEQAGFEMRDRLLELVAGDARVRTFMASLSLAQREAFLACVAESEVGPELHWVFGTGFPKSHSPSLMFEKTLCTRRDVAATGERPRFEWFYADGAVMRRKPPFRHPEAERWAGTGTALKPAYEPIFLARKPLDGNVAENLLAHGTGAMNIGACRIATDDNQSRPRGSFPYSDDAWGNGRANEVSISHPAGRWPANLIHDASNRVVAEFPSSDARNGGRTSGARASQGYGLGAAETPVFRDSGSAARYFYAPKADRADRAGSTHPTVKPIELLRWLVRLTLPAGGTVLDPFAGTGTTGAAALLEGCSAVLIEQSPDYCADIARRLAAVRPADPRGHAVPRPFRRRRRAAAAAALPQAAE